MPAGCAYVPGEKHAPAVMVIVKSIARTATVAMKAFNLIPRDRDSSMSE
jgi:hypothetical protein